MYKFCLGKNRIKCIIICTFINPISVPPHVYRYMARFQLQVRFLTLHRCCGETNHFFSGTTSLIPYIPAKSLP